MLLSPVVPLKRQGKVLHLNSPWREPFSLGRVVPLALVLAVVVVTVSNVRMQTDQISL